MKSVGEAMAIGRTFKESLQKCLRSLEIGRSGLGGDGKPWRIGTEVYGDREVLPRDVISPKTFRPECRTDFLHSPRFARRFHRRRDFQPHKNRPLVPGADQRDCGLRGRAGGREELMARSNPVFSGSCGCDPSRSVCVGMIVVVARFYPLVFTGSRPAA